MHIFEYDLFVESFNNEDMKIQKRKNISGLILISALAFSCASKSRPSLYPNEVLKERGQVRAEADINQCLNDAEVYLKSPEGKKVAKGGSFGTSVGVGTSIGIGSGTGVGLGVGVGGGNRVSGLDVKRMFVNQCLTDKGYQVLAWD